jgi:WXG100 family type VII secretion target
VRPVVGFHVDPVELQVCGGMLRQISDEVRTALRNLESEMDALLTGGWQGSAADGFAQGWQQWRAGAGEVLDGLETMGRLLGQTGQDYHTVDGNSTDTLNQAGQGL